MKCNHVNLERIAQAMCENMLFVTIYYCDDCNQYIMKDESHGLLLIEPLLPKSFYIYAGSIIGICLFLAGMVIGGEIYEMLSL